MTPADWRRVTRGDIIAQARQIARSLVDQGLTPTLRQLYYQMVAAGLCPNGQRVYKRIGAALTAARYSGEFPINYINDRTRSPSPTNTYLVDDVDEAINAALSDLADAPQKSIWANRWRGQPTLVSVWVEKEALAGVFERPCRALGVGLFVCRGYPSVSALADWMKAQDGAITDETRRVAVLYFGDHDPDGLCIPDAAMASMRQLAEVMPLADLFGRVPVRLERVALTQAQIAEVDAPPFPAKPSSSRFEAYVEATGLDEAWELDALPPAYLDALIRHEVTARFDAEVYASLRSHVVANREEMRERMTSTDFLEELAERLGVGA